MGISILYYVLFPYDHINHHLIISIFGFQEAIYRAQQLHRDHQSQERAEHRGGAGGRASRHFTRVPDANGGSNEVVEQASQ